MSDMNEQEGRQTILIVDDASENVALMSSVLKASYRTKVAREGETALRLSSMDGPPDLILLDVVMPGMDGYEVCRRLKENSKTADIPVIFITALSEIEDEQRGLDLGAVDYITKPISPPILAARVRTHLRLKSARDFLRDKSEFLEQEVERRTQQINAIQDTTMVALGSLAETRDNETGNHIRRTQYYIMKLAQKMSEHSAFAETLTPVIIRHLYKSAPLHDIGKVGIPDRILLKPGKLTEEEFEIMKTHTSLGRNAILAAEKLLDSPTTFLHQARETTVLLAAAADVNALNIFGGTPLMYAAEYNPNPDVITTLLKAGADAKAKDKAGKTAFDYAQANAKLKGSNAYRKLNEATNFFERRKGT